MIENTAALAGISKIRDALAPFVFKARDEADLQSQVMTVLLGAGLKVDREVIAERGRYDLLVEFAGRDRVARIVLELKVAGSTAAIERQAQKYALTPDVDLVAIVTTMNRIASRLASGGSTLGGKPFTVITLRTF